MWDTVSGMLDVGTVPLSLRQPEHSNRELAVQVSGLSDAGCSLNGGVGGTHRASMQPPHPAPQRAPALP